MAEWKDEVRDALDEAKDEGAITKKVYDKIKAALDAANTAKDFINADDILDILKKLAKKQTVGIAAAGSIVTIMVTILGEGPCLWTGVMTGILARKAEKALNDSDLDEWECVMRVRRRFISAHNQCLRDAQKEKKHVNHEK